MRSDNPATDLRGRRHLLRLYAYRNTCLGGIYRVVRDSEVTDVIVHSLKNDHGVAIAVKPVLFLYCCPIRSLQQFNAGKCTDQQQQS